MLDISCLCAECDQIQTSTADRVRGMSAEEKAAFTEKVRKKASGFSRNGKDFYKNLASIIYVGFSHVMQEAAMRDMASDERDRMR